MEKRPWGHGRLCEESEERLTLFATGLSRGGSLYKMTLLNNSSLPRRAMVTELRVVQFGL